MEKSDIIRDISSKPKALKQPSFQERASYPPRLRVLSVDELTNTTCVNLLLNEIYSQDAEIAELRDTLSKFHEKDNENAVLKEKLLASKGTDAAHDALLSLGCLLLGLSYSLWTGIPNNHIYSGLSALIGAISFISGVRVKR